MNIMFKDNSWKVLRILARDLAYLILPGMKSAGGRWDLINL